MNALWKLQFSLFKANGKGSRRTNLMVYITYSTDTGTAFIPLHFTLARYSLVFCIVAVIDNQSYVGHAVEKSLNMDKIEQLVIVGEVKVLKFPHSSLFVKRSFFCCCQKVSCSYQAGNCDSAPCVSERLKRNNIQK